MAKLFSYKARDSSGIGVSGQVEAENVKTVSHSLKELGYVVVSIEEIKAGKFKPLALLKSRFFAVNQSDVLLFWRQMSAMINAGLPLLNAMGNVIEQMTNVNFRKILVNVASDIRGGKSLSDALSRYPNLFSPFHINMIKAGETGGMLGDVLERLAVIGYEEKELKGRVQSAFAYPVLLIGLSILIVTALLTFVLPKFIGIFQESGTRLPVPTMILLMISMVLRKFWFIPLGSLVILVLYARKSFKKPQSRFYIHKHILAMPLVGRIILIIAVSRFCKIMGALTKSGISLLNALAVSEGLLSNQVLLNALSHTRHAVIEGASLSNSLKVSGVFPPMMVQMIAVGESTGKLDEMFSQIGDFYDKESALVIRTMTTLIEPVLLLFMGVIVGFIALSVLLPIFNLVKVLKR